MTHLRSSAIIASTLVAAFTSIAFAEPANQTTNQDGRVIVAQAPAAQPPMTPAARPPMMPQSGGPMTPGMPAAGTMPMMAQMGQGGMMGMMMRMGDHVEGRIAFLRAELRITEAQVPLWNAFAEALRANARKMGEMQQAMMGQAAAPMTLPQRIAQHETMVTAHLEAFRAMRTAVQPLYAALSDDQKRIADTLIHGPMGMGMM